MTKGRQMVKTAFQTAAFVLALSGVALLLVACGNSSAGGPGPVPVPPPAPVPTPVNTLVPSVYVGNMTTTNQAQVLQFARGSTGVSTPLATLTLPSGFSISCLTTDVSGQIYVGGSIAAGSSSQWEVLVYAAGASGMTTPLRTVLGSSSSFLTVVGITTDASGQLYISSNQPAPLVAVMAANASGAATPVRLITGGLTKLYAPTYGLAVDVGGMLYVGNSNTAAIEVFSSTATGNMAPVRVIAGSNTGLIAPFGLDVDSSGNVYILSVYQIPGASTVTTLAEFSSTASGNASPLKTISGSATGLNTFASFVRVDSTGTAYVSGDNSGVTPFVSTFPSSASGSVPPHTSFTSSTWSGPGYLGLALR